MRSLLHKVALLTFPIVAGALIAACGGGYSSPTAPTGVGSGGGGGAPATLTITIVGQNGSQSFTPNPGSVKAGQTVAWRNSDVITHTATANSGAFDTGSIPPGATSNPITMMTAGSLAYHCSIHPTMTGTVTVTQ